MSTETTAETTPPSMSPWQGEDGFPTDGYFKAVHKALTDAGVTVDDWWRDEDWDVSFELGEGSRRGYAALCVAWRVDEMDAPKHANDFTGHGWIWVAYYTDAQKALGDHVEDFPLAYLAETEDIAAAVAALVDWGHEEMSQ